MSDKRNSYDHVSGSVIAVKFENTPINKFHTKGETGFAAEEANAFADFLDGVTVEQVGKSNEANGPDRIASGVLIQTKYFDSAASTVRAAFDEQGVYRYAGQQLEVPRDQYEDCISLMREEDALAENQAPTVHMEPVVAAPLVAAPC